VQIEVTTPGSLAVRVRKYRYLWNNLQQLTVGISRALSAALLQANLLLMSLNLITAFGVLGAVIANVNALRIFVMLAVACATHLQMLFMSSSGYACAEKVSRKKKKKKQTRVSF